LKHFKTTSSTGQSMDNKKLGATGKSSAQGKAQQGSTVAKLPFSYHIVNARYAEHYKSFCRPVLL